MFAVIKTGGKQYKVAKDATIRVEKLAGEPGEKVSFGEVLVVGEGASAKIGSPLVAGASVEGEIVKQYRDDKVTIIKKKRRQGYHRKKGHRQHLTAVKITGITA